MGYKILAMSWRDIKNPDVGGSEVSLHETFKRLVARGHEVTLLSSRYDRSFPEEEEVDGVRVIRRGNRHTFNFTVPRVYWREFRNASIDIVIDCLNKIPFYSPLFIRRPIFVTIHHIHASSIYGDTFLPAGLYVHLTELLIPLFYRGIPFVTISESTKAELVRMGLRAENVEIVYCGADHENYGPDESLRSTDPLVVCVTRFKKYKGPHLLIKAMEKVRKEIPEAKLILAGKGAYENKLHALVSKLGLEGAVEIVGYVNREEKANLYRRAQVVVNPSAKEGWGLTVIEANACATPVVAADSQGLRDSVVDGKTGLLYPHSDTDAMARAIVRLLKDKELRTRLGQNGIEWSDRFTWDEAADQTEAIIERVIKNADRQRQ
jgi:glycosyltransferase involved in cell wall biosynthesis